MANKPKITPITGAAFKVAEEFRAIVDAGQAEQELLEKEFKDRNEVIYERTMSQLKALWMQMATLIGIDAEKSWQNPKYKFVYKFIEHGFAAIEEREVQPSPFDAMMGAVPEEAASELEDTPTIDKSKLN